MSGYASFNIWHRGQISRNRLWSKQTPTTMLGNKTVKEAQHTAISIQLLFTTTVGYLVYCNTRKKTTVVLRNTYYSAGPRHTTKSIELLFTAERTVSIVTLRQSQLCQNQINLVSTLPDFTRPSIRHLLKNLL